MTTFDDTKNWSHPYASDQEFAQDEPELAAILGKPYTECPDSILGYWPILDDQNLIVGFTGLDGDDEWILLDENLNEFDPEVTPQTPAFVRPA